MNLWEKLRATSVDSGHPIIGLSPMDGVSDHPFRHITKKYGQPDVMYTEFTSVEGVCHKATRLLEDFLYDETQRPIVAQIYGTTPSFFRQTAVILCELGFDGIDINMGCPAKNVAHSGAGASLIKTPQLAQEIIRETKAGVQDWLNGKRSRDCEDIAEEIWQEVEKRASELPEHIRSAQTSRVIPVSVKTRIGYEQPVISEWIPRLLEMEVAAIALHGRTLKQQYGGKASWEEIGNAAEIVHTTSTLILGNGDASSRADAEEKATQYGLDGVLIGRAAMGNPFAFLTQSPTLETPSIFQIAFEHAQIYERTFAHKPMYNFLPMRKHLGWYIHDIPNAAQIRQEIYRTNSSQEFAAVLQKHGILLKF